MNQQSASTNERDAIVNKYMRLSRESDRLRQRLTMALPLNTTTPFSSSSRKSSSSSTVSSPTSGSTSRGESVHYYGRSTSHSPITSPRIESHSFFNEACPTPPLPGAQHSYAGRSAADSADETALFEVNQQIKATLTELLNCHNVKSDQDFRGWVQDRLMEAEQEIRKQRRRRSSAERRGRTDLY